MARGLRHDPGRARAPSDIPHAAIAPAADGWVVYAFTAGTAAPFLAPLIGVAAEDGPYEGFDVAMRIALTEDAPDIDDCARA